MLCRMWSVRSASEITSEGIDSDRKSTSQTWSGDWLEHASEASKQQRKYRLQRNKFAGRTSDLLRRTSGCGKFSTPKA